MVMLVIDDEWETSHLCRPCAAQMLTAVENKDNSYSMWDFSYEHHGMKFCDKCGAHLRARDDARPS